MRGGAIPPLAWGTLLLVLLAINWIWTGDAIQVGSFGFAALVVYGAALGLWLGRREALRRGPPPPEPELDPEPEASVAAVVIGLSIACVLFGVVWSNFLVLFGAGTLLLSLGRLVIELRAERATRRQARVTIEGRERSG
jgi:hypothetical protein